MTLFACPNCGTENRRTNASFCYNCGAGLSTNEEPVPVNSRLNDAETPTSRKTAIVWPEKSSKSYLWPIPVVLFLAGIFILLHNQMKSSNAGISNGSQPQQSAGSPNESGRTDELVGWQVSHLSDGIRGTSKTTIHRSAEGEETMIAPAQLWIYCPDGEDAYSVLFSGLHMLQDSGPNTVTYRFDARPPQEGLWKTEDYKTLWPEDPFLASAVNSKDVWIEFRTGPRSVTQLHFQLTGLRQQFQQFCKLGSSEVNSPVAQ